MIVIYTPKVTNRIKYTFDFVFYQYFGIDYKLTEDSAIAKDSKNLYIHYAATFKPDFYSVYFSNLLAETNIEPQNITISMLHHFPVFFQTQDVFNLPFDIFSCIFYLLSRYEEYLPHEKDMHGRYVSSNSILANPAFNFSPIVEIWLNYFKQELLKLNPNLTFKKYKLEYTPTFDIDHAYKYKARNWFKNPPNIFNADFIKTILNLKGDSYDIYDKIESELQRYNFQPIFFFLLNDSDKNDSNVSPRSARLHLLVRRFAKYKLGIHPSYSSFENNWINQECNHLQQISSQPIEFSRQHFLKINFPTYYRKLIELNILYDFSLAYPDVVGFRAGYSRAFYFFDVEKNEVTNLLLQPACFMDATFEYYQTNKFDDIHDKFFVLLNQLKEINGNLVPIFHNDLLVKEKYWGIFSFMNQQLN